MNKLIKELAEQATELKQNTVIDPVTYTMVLSQTYRRELNAEKFAELIVRECISTIENAENGYQDYRDQIEDGMRNHCISLIKNKFGVEE